MSESSPTRAGAPSATTPRADLRPPFPEQYAVNRALSGYVESALRGESHLMIHHLTLVSTAGEQQVQRAMLFVQQQRALTRSALLVALVGDARCRDEGSRRR